MIKKIQIHLLYIHMGYEITPLVTRWRAMISSITAAGVQIIFPTESESRSRTHIGEESTRVRCSKAYGFLIASHSIIVNPAKRYHFLQKKRFVERKTKKLLPKLWGCLVHKPNFFGCHINSLTRYREGFSDTN